MYVSRDVKFLEDHGFYEEKDWESLKDLAASSDRTSSLRFILDHLGNHPTPKPTETSLPVTRQSFPRQESSSRDEAESSRDEAEVPRHEAGLPRHEAGLPRHGVDLPQPAVATRGRSCDTRQTCRTPILPIHAETSDDLDEAHVHESAEESSCPEEATAPSQPQPQLRRSTRPRSDPSTWRDKRVYYNGQAVAHPIQAVCSLALLPIDHQVFIGKLDQDVIPQSYEEARASKDWNDAVEDEKSAMIRNHTWDEADLPPGKKAVSSKWVFTIKHLSNGDIERYKARLVARGFTQTYGEDYTDTFAPVAKLHTVRVMLSLATNLDWDLWQMDVKNAFLQGELEEEVYMTPPPGLEDTIAPGKVFRLRKAIYGLKQSPRAWYHKLSSTLKARGFKKSESDHTLFTLHGSKGLVAVLIYVDDLIITGDDKEGIQETKAFLKTVFDIKDLGELKYFLGIEVCRLSDGLFISQRKYTLDLLQETGMMGAKPAKTPLEDGYKVDRKGEKEDEPYEDVGRYRRLVLERKRDEEGKPRQTKEEPKVKLKEEGKAEASERVAEGLSQ